MSVLDFFLGERCVGGWHEGIAAGKFFAVLVGLD